MLTDKSMKMYIKRNTLNQSNMLLVSKLNEATLGHFSISLRGGRGKKHVMKGNIFPAQAAIGFV